MWHPGHSIPQTRPSWPGSTSAGATMPPGFSVTSRVTPMTMAAFRIRSASVPASLRACAAIVVSMSSRTVSPVGVVVTSSPATSSSTSVSSRSTPTSAPGRHGKLFTCWYQFGSGQLPQAAADDRLILAERDIEEGRLQVVANDAQPPTVRLEPSPALLPSLLDDDAKTPPWWIRMYTRRVFTPAEFLEADARKVIPGPFRHRYPPSAYRPPAEPNSSPPAELSPAQGPAPAPAPPPLERIPASVENLLETLPAALRGQARRTWASWFREQDEPG